MFIDTVHIPNMWSFLDQRFLVKKANLVRKAQRPLRRWSWGGELAASFLGWKQRSQRGEAQEARRP